MDLTGSRILTEAGGFFIKLVMAAGRGEFFRSFLEGLERKPSQPAPGRRQPGRGRGRGKPGPGGGESGPGRGGGKRRKRPPKAAPSSASGSELR